MVLPSPAIGLVTTTTCGRPSSSRWWRSTRNAAACSESGSRTIDSRLSGDLSSGKWCWVRPTSVGVLPVVASGPACGPAAATSAALGPDAMPPSPDGITVVGDNDPVGSTGGIGLGPGELAVGLWPPPSADGLPNTADTLGASLGGSIAIIGCVTSGRL